MLMTRWSKTLSADSTLREYPRPQLRRESYFNLNGYWSYTITEGDDKPVKFDGDILVPFSPESALSGVNRTLLPSQTLWYSKKLDLPDGFVKDGERLLLHFGAVDQEAAVYVNGKEAARHLGGYTSFDADITDAFEPGCELLLRVRDETDIGFRTRGKQSMKRGGIWYTPQSGIWQTVWLESVPNEHITGLLAIPDIAKSELELTVFASADMPCEVHLQGKSHTLTSNKPERLRIDEPRLWSPDAPYLYEFSVTLGKDKVESYFAMRSVSIGKDENGAPRFMLNGKPLFLSGLLDQGYWPDGLYTPLSDEAMIYDIETAKRLGYNMLRKHIKIEPMRWYYHCDRLGMLVWQDMPSGSGNYGFLTISSPLITGIHIRDNRYRRFRRESAEGREQFRRELGEMITQLRNSPCIVTWVPFNEGWGQFDAADAVEQIRRLDPSRPIDHASGWHDQGAGDYRSLHVYFTPYHFKKDKRGRAVALTEFGGYNLRVSGHCHNEKDFGYKRLKSADKLAQAYRRLYESEIIPAVSKGLCAAIYTQLTDVENELNGIMTYDREVIKLDEAAVAEINRRLIGE